MQLKLPARPWKRTRPVPAAEPQPLDPARQQLVAQIIEINPTATTAFLAAFEASALRNYLDHLHAAQLPRGPQARWVRQGESPAIMCRERAD